MRVENMKSSNGNSVPNQFIITDEGRGALGNFKRRDVFQSHDTVIAERVIWDDCERVTLDKNKWDYSTTTGKYRNKFLGETKKETEKKIADGTYKLADLNK